MAEQAVGELSYEIDTEIVAMLYEAAKANTTDAEAKYLAWSNKLPHGVNKRDHYAGFGEKLDRAMAIIYKRTQKFDANYMVCSREVVSILKFVEGFKEVTGKKVGPYKAGTISGLNVYVSSILEGGDYFVGLNAGDLQTSAGIYAPYMAIVPTATLETPDGGIATGYSTWYAKAIVNPQLLVAGNITIVEDDTLVY